MKIILKSLRIGLLSALALTAAPAAHAQVNINLAPPSWGPAVPAGAQYYYIPETRGFYDVPARQYIVQRDGRWIRTSSLSGYNPSNFHPVVVDYVGAEPWSRYDEYRARYPRGGNPSNGALPPGQAKKQGYRANPSNGGLPPGQAKKQGAYRGRDDDDRRREAILGVRLPDDRRYDNRRDDDDDDRGKSKNKEYKNTEYKQKGKGKDYDND